MAAIIYGSLDYNKRTDTWLVCSASGDVVPLQEGNAITIGHLCGITVRAILERDKLSGQWTWAVTTLPQMPFDGALVSIPRPVLNSSTPG